MKCRKPKTITEQDKNDLFPEMKNENWKPSFIEVATSKSWTQHLMMYFVSFGTLLYFLFSPQKWVEWTFIILAASVLTIGYWTMMINFNRNYFKKKNQQLLREKRKLEMDEQKWAENYPDLRPEIKSENK